MPSNVRDILAGHEAGLIDRLEKLRTQMIPLERELAEVRRAILALESTDYGPQQRQMIFPGSDSDLSPEGPASELTSIIYFDAFRRTSPYAKLTIKALVRKALDEQFQRGATASELLDFFRNAWGRADVVRTSLSPQLSRLKQDGEVILVGQRWMLRRAFHTPDEPDQPKAATDT
jgi:hypothetical protein